MLEILPASAVLDPDAPLGIRHRPPTFEPVSSHVLVSTTVSGEAILAAAAGEGGRAEEVETGLFKVIKLWIDGALLAEFLAQEEKARYVEAFGGSGLPSLDGKLRDLEVMVAARSGCKPQ